MKKINLLLIAIFAFGFTNAQDIAINGFSKGDKFAEGAFSFRTGDVEDSWGFTPKMGIMLDNKLAVGGFLAMAGTDDKNNNKTGTYGIGGFVRYYFVSLGASKSFNAYGEFGLGYSSITTDPNIGSKNTDSAMNANIDLGLNYFITPHWAATFILANILSYNNVNPESGSNASDLTININLYNNIFATPQFGLLYKW